MAKSIELLNGQLAITGYPEAIKVAKLEDERSRTVADLTLQLLDLRFAQDCLLSINQVPPDQVVVRNAVWLSSIIRFFKKGDIPIKKGTFLYLDVDWKRAHS
jgi:hypothetical protein